MRYARGIQTLAVVFTLLLGACATDDIVEPEPEEPALSLSGASDLSWEREVGESAQAEFRIANLGEEELTFDLESDADWLSTSMAGGEVAGGDEIGVELTATCPDEPGELSTELRVLTNDPENESVAFGIALNCTAIPPGDLAIDVVGLPETHEAQITVAGPDGYSESVTESAILSDLAIGEYTVSAESVGQDAVYEPSPESQSVTVERNAEATVTVDYTVVTGAVQIDVEGLPDGVEPELELSGPSTAQPVDASGLVEDLAPGLYTVTPADVEDGGSLYKASQVDVEVRSDEVTQATIEYLLDPGAVAVDLSGLPDGVTYDVELVAGDGSSTAVPQSGELAAVEPGAYDVVAQEVADGLATYEATEVSPTSIVVESGDTAMVDVVYAVISGELTVTISGLSGQNAEVQIVGPDQTLSVEETTTFSDLEPGTYEVNVDDVIDGPARYEAASTTVDVASGDAAEVAVDYALVTGGLNVEISGDLGAAAADVTISGPEFDATISSNDSFSGLIPGEYSVVAADVSDGPTNYEGTGQTVTVESGQTAVATVVYEVVTGSLPLVINGLPEGVAANVELVGESTATVENSQTVADLVPGDYTVSVGDVIDGDRTYAGDDTTVSVASGSNDPVVIDYDLIYASLAIDIDGDLGGSDADIDVTGPEGFSTTVTTNTTLEELLPGDYTVSVNDVIDGAMTYDGQGSQSLSLASGDSQTVVATYEALSGGIAIDVVDFGQPDFEVVMTGPDGFSEVITASNIFDTAQPGDYSLEVTQVASDADGNEGYVSVDPSSFTLESGTQETVTIEAGAPALVTHGGDDGPGSLRQVLTSVVDDTVVEFDASVSQVTLSSGEIVVDGVRALMSGGDRVTVTADGSRHFRVSAGAIFIIENLGLSGGSASDGGAIYVDAGLDGSTKTSLDIFNTEFVGNQATTHGGAIYSEDIAEIGIRDSLFANNTAGSDGGAYAAKGDNPDLVATIEASLFEGNAADDGGALYLTGDTTVRESTFFDNQATSRGGAIYVYWQESIFEGITVTGNSADTGGGILHWSDGFATGQMGRSVVAGNTATTADDDIAYHASTTEEFISAGYNIIGVASGDFVDGVDGDQVGSDTSPLDPQLQALSDNGGPTPTMAPSASSPARLAVPAAECEALSTALPVYDQRGQRRPAGAYCSAGAYEIDAALETFGNADMSAGGYGSGSFVGDDGVVWNYEEARRDTSGYEIEGTGVILRDSTSRLSTQTLSGGVSSVSMQLSKAFTGAGDRQVELYINDVLVGTSQAFDESGDAPYPAYRFGVGAIDVSGDFVIEVRNVGSQIVIDNLTWE